MKNRFVAWLLCLAMLLSIGAVAVALWLTRKYKD